MTNRYTRQYILLVLAFAVLGFGLLIFYGKPATVDTSKLNVSVYIADDQVERVKGLSGRESLQTDQGMLFVFDTEDKHSIWMKDMKFNIDVVWLGSDKKVTEYRTNISPATYPKIFAPKNNARYILELPAGQVAKRMIAKGVQLSFTTVVD